MNKIVKGMFKDQPNESHNHLCVEKLIAEAIEQLGALDRIWSDFNLGCREIKKYLTKNVF